MMMNNLLIKLIQITSSRSSVDNPGSPCIFLGGIIEGLY